MASRDRDPHSVQARAASSEPRLWAEDSALVRLEGRRRFIQRLGAGAALTALGGAIWKIASDTTQQEARAESRPDGRSRVPPGQRVIDRLKPMGGQEGDWSPRAFRLRVHGEVEAPFTLDFRELVGLPTARAATSDVHCVTGWTVLDARWTGVRIADLAALAKVKPTARHLILEAAEGYTANVRLSEGLAPNAMVVWEYEQQALGVEHGAPVRGLVPDLYFWKSAKWLTGLRFQADDAPGYWETRGYNNHADPWSEERYG